LRRVEYLIPTATSARLVHFQAANDYCKRVVVLYIVRKRMEPVFRRVDVLSGRFDSSYNGTDAEGGVRTRGWNMNSYVNLILDSEAARKRLWSRFEIERETDRQSRVRSPADQQLLTSVLMTPFRSSCNWKKENPQP
jgi:hypothetical protein